MSKSAVLLANSNKQSLAAHGALVGLLARRIISEIYPAAGLEDAALLSGIFHDIGKADPSFQKFILEHECSTTEEDGAHILEGKKTKGFSFNEYPRHNEISWSLLTTGLDEAGLTRTYLKGQSSLWEAVKYAVFWHHAKPLRSNPEAFKTNQAILGPMEPALQERLASLLVDTFEFALLDFNKDLLLEAPTERVDFCPEFKAAYSSGSSAQLAKSVLAEATRSALRSALVHADRIVSALTAKEVVDWLEVFRATAELPPLATGDALELAKKEQKGVTSQIREMLARFEVSYPSSVRNAQQSEAAIALAARQLAVLQGPAGCGKTKIMLEYLAQCSGEKRAFVFVPRTAIGQGLFDELVHEYGVNASIEIYTGDVKLQARGGLVQPIPDGDELASRLVITTLDQLCSIALSHRKIDFLSEVMRSTVIVDEFHEVFDIAGLVLLFLELMALRFKAQDHKTLLISATPNPYFLEALGKFDLRTRAPALKDCVVKVPTFNEQPFHLSSESFRPDEPHPFERHLSQGNILVANTAIRAQQSALKALEGHTPTLCFHSKFTPRHKKRVLQDVMRYFGKSSGSTERLLCAGPIVQASLNITTRELHTEATHAENYLQRLGRVNRFGAFPAGTMVMHTLLDKGKEGQVDKNLLGRLAQRWRSQAWVDYFRAQPFAEGAVTSLAEMYRGYDRFHAEAATREAYAKDFEAILEKSFAAFEQQDFDPIQIPKPKSAGKSGRKLASKSLRGTSYFVLPIHRKLEEGKAPAEDWLYTELSADEDRLTDSLTLLKGLSDEAKGRFIQYMYASDLKVMHWRGRLPGALREKFKRKGAVRRLSQWLSFAKDGATPLVLRLQGMGKTPEEYEQLYLEKNGVLLGLMPAKKS